MENNSEKGFILPIILALIGILVIGIGVYFYKNKKAEAPAVVGTEQKDTQTPATDPNQDWQTHKSEEHGFEFNYSKKLSLSATNGTISLSHSIPFDNYDGGCDMSGEAQLSKTLVDFGLSIKIVPGTVNPPHVDGAYSKGILTGERSYMGAEGCGQTSYYFPAPGNRTLIVIKNEIQILSPVVSPEVRDEVLAVPGVISYEESRALLDQILSSFKFTK